MENILKKIINNKKKYIENYKKELTENYIVNNSDVNIYDKSLLLTTETARKNNSLCGENAIEATLCPSFYKAKIINNPNIRERSMAWVRNKVIGLLT